MNNLPNSEPTKDTNKGMGKIRGWVWLLFNRRTYVYVTNKGIKVRRFPLPWKRQAKLTIGEMGIYKGNITKDPKYPKYRKYLEETYGFNRTPPKGNQDE